MDNMLACEARFRDHYATAADVDRDGWRKPTRTPRAYRVALAKSLIALASRLAPTVREPAREPAPARTATA